MSLEKKYPFTSLTQVLCFVYPRITITKEQHWLWKGTAHHSVGYKTPYVVIGGERYNVKRMIYEFWLGRELEKNDKLFAIEGPTENLNPEHQQVINGFHSVFELTEQQQVELWTQIKEKIKRGENGCQEIKAPTETSFGHQTFQYNNWRWYAHRVMYELGTGKRLVPGQNVLHKCNNPRCVNPDHLRIGSQKDNVLQMLEQERKPNISEYAFVIEVIMMYTKGARNLSRNTWIQAGKSVSAWLSLVNGKTWEFLWNQLERDGVITPEENRARTRPARLQSKSEGKTKK